jgi:rod shape-determining protein MreC
MRGSTREIAGRNDVLLFAGCTALALVALILPHSWGVAAAGALRQTIFRPLVVMQSRAVQDRTARFAFKSLQHSHDSLAALVLQQQALRRENDNLRGIAQVRARMNHPVVSAEVLHRPTITDSRMLLLDAGKHDGVQLFDPVVTADGLIGYVTGVADRSSVAITWDHPDFSASAVTVNGVVRGFVRPAQPIGLSYPTLELQGVAMRDSLALGTMVVTAGAGGTFPRGIPIGRIVGVQRELYGYDRIYRVAPFANPGDASHVIILTFPRDSTFPGPAALKVP